MELYNEDEFIKYREEKNFDCEEKELSEENLSKCTEKGKKE